MTRPIQRYQDELGLAIARELSRNDLRSRRGRTPLQPSLQNGVNDAKGYADQTAYNNATYYGNAYANNAYNGAISNDQNVTADAHWYADDRDRRLIPPGCEIMWSEAVSGGIPAGWYDTGRTVQLDGANSRKVIRKA